MHYALFKMLCIHGSHFPSEPCKVGIMLFLLLVQKMKPNETE